MDSGTPILEVLCRYLRRALSSLARRHPRRLSTRPPCRLLLLPSPRSNPRQGTAGPPSLSRAQQLALSQARVCDAACTASSPLSPSAGLHRPETSAHRRRLSSLLLLGVPHRPAQHFLWLRRSRPFYPRDNIKLELTSCVSFCSLSYMLKLVLKVK